MATFVKGQAIILDWTLLDDTATFAPIVDTGAQTDLSTDLSNLLNIVVAHIDVVDASTSYVTVQVLIRMGADTDDNWTVWRTTQAGGGQATAEALNANSGASEGGTEDQMHVASTADFDTGLLERLILYKPGTIADSTLVTIVGWSDNVHYLAENNLIASYTNADTLFDGVDELQVRLPAEATAYKVIFGNSHGTATYAVRVTRGDVTSIG